MNNKKQLNTFISGMMLDSHPSTASDTMLTNCLNGTLITYGDNLYVLLNDLGNGKIYSDKEKLNPAQLPHELFFNQETESKYSLCENLYRPVGMKEHNGILYIVSLNIKSKLYYLYKENPTINEWKKADTVTLSVSNTCKYIINIEVTAADYDTLQTLKVGYLKHYNDLGEEVDSTELTVELFLLRIKDDINKIDFLEIRHLDDENAIVYKGSEIGSFPSPLYERLDNVVSTEINYSETDPVKTFTCDLYSDGYKLEDHSLAFGDYLRIEAEDNNKTDEVLLLDVTELNNNLSKYLPSVLKELFNLNILLSLDNVSIDITDRLKLLYNSKEELTKDNSYVIPQSEEGVLLFLFNLSTLYDVNKDNIIFYYNDKDSTIYTTGSINVTYNAPDGNGSISNNTFDFKMHSDVEHTTKTDLINSLVIKDENLTFKLIKTDSELKENELDAYSMSEVILTGLNYYINRKILLKSHPIIEITNLNDLQDIECNFLLLGSSSITDAKDLKYEFSKKIPVDRLIKDAISLFLFNYDFSKEPNIFNYSITLIELKLPYTNLKLYFDFIPITKFEVQEEDIITSLIMELNSEDRLGTFRVFNGSISVENLTKSYAVVFYAIVDGIMSYIDTQYYINYSDYTNLNYLLFRQDIYDSTKNTGRILNYNLSNVNYNSDNANLAIDTILIDGEDYSYNFYILDEINKNELQGKLKLSGFLTSNLLPGSRSLRPIYVENQKIVENRYNSSSIALSNTTDVVSNITPTEDYSSTIKTKPSGRAAYYLTLKNPEPIIDDISVRNNSNYRFIKKSDILSVDVEVLASVYLDFGNLYYSRFRFIAEPSNGQTTKLFDNLPGYETDGFINLLKHTLSTSYPLIGPDISNSSYLTLNLKAIVLELLRKNIVPSLGNSKEIRFLLTIRFTSGTTNSTTLYTLIVLTLNIVNGSPVKQIEVLMRPNIIGSDTTVIALFEDIYKKYIDKKYIIREENLNQECSTKKYISFYDSNLDVSISRTVNPFIKIDTVDVLNVIQLTKNYILNNKYQILDKDISYISKDFILSNCLNKDIIALFPIVNTIKIDPDYQGDVDWFDDTTYGRKIYSYVEYGTDFRKLCPISGNEEKLVYNKGILYAIKTQDTHINSYTPENDYLINPSTNNYRSDDGYTLAKYGKGAGNSSSDGEYTTYGTTIYLNKNSNITNYTIRTLKEEISGVTYFWVVL